MIFAAPVFVGAQTPEPEDPRFSHEEYRIKETQKVATLWVERESAGTARTASFSTSQLVSFPQSDGGSGVATANADYKPVSGKLEFAKGDRGPKAIKITIMDDRVKESEESIFLTLSDDTGVLDATRLRITSNEPLPSPTAPPAAPPGAPGGVPGGPPGAAPPAGAADPKNPAPVGGVQAGPGSDPAAGPADATATSEATGDASPAAGNALSIDRLKRNPAALAGGGAGLVALLALAFRAIRKARLGA